MILILFFIVILLSSLYSFPISRVFQNRKSHPLKFSYDSKPKLIEYEVAREQVNLWRNISRVSSVLNDNKTNFIVSESDVNNTIGYIKTSQYLVAKQSFTTLNRAYKACKEGLVLVNNTKVYSTHKLRIGDVITIEINQESIHTMNEIQLKEEEIYLQRLLNFTNSLINVEETVPHIKILYEDDHIAVVFKPSGIHSLRWIGTMKKRFFALDDVLPLLLTPPIDLLHNNTNRYKILERPLPCHRLDARVSGCIVVAKTQQSLIHINSQFANRVVHKQYIAIVAGKINNTSSSELDITYPVGGRPAHTILKIIDETPCNVYGTLSRVLLSPLTGRRHQLRQHCVALGCPILGDDLYHSAACLPTLQERLLEINKISKINNIEKDFDDNDIIIDKLTGIDSFNELDDNNNSNNNELNNLNNNKSSNVRKGIGLLLASVGIDFQYPDEIKPKLIEENNNNNNNDNNNNNNIEYIKYNEITNIFSAKIIEPKKFTKIFSKAAKGANWLKNKS